MTDSQWITCDSCRSAFAKAPGIEIADALAYLALVGWSVVIAPSGITATICPRCTRHRKDPEQ